MKQIKEEVEGLQENKNVDCVVLADLDKESDAREMFETNSSSSEDDDDDVERHKQKKNIIQ